LGAKEFLALSRRIGTGTLPRDEEKNASIAGRDFQRGRVAFARRIGPMTGGKQNTGCSSTPGRS
jgi:hypothetical protein